jgi:hypothetical protein
MRIVLLVFITALLCCSSRLENSAIKDKAYTAYIYSFQTAVLSHNLEDVYDHLDAAYAAEQFAFLDNKKQLVNELFCGTDKNEKYQCAQLYEIRSIEHLKTEQATDSDTERVYFLIQTDTHSFTIHFGLSKNEDNPNTYGIIGAVG